MTEQSENLEKLQLRAADGAQVEIHSHGAHVTSWIPAAGTERLFLSSRTVFRPGVAIRGGIPVIFPQFAAEGPLVKHGFARTSLWQFIDAVTTPTGAQVARYQLQESPTTLPLWPFPFLAELHVTVGGASLQVALHITNTGVQAFRFTTALHTYLRVHDIDAVVVVGLRDMHYRDSADGNALRIEDAPQLRIRGEVDRIYFQTPAELSVIEPDRATLIRQRGFVDTVIWNPGAERATALQDMEPEGYRRMLCVEAAVIGIPIELAPGQSWLGSQEIVAP